MILETIALDKAITLATPLAKKLFTSKLLPLLEDKISDFFQNKTALKRFETESVKYIAKLTGKCSILNTIAFQNAPMKLEDLYIPLTLKLDSRGTEIVVDEQADIFHYHPHVLINDIAGMGKSTLSKKIIMNVIDQGEFIPVFIELRQLEDKPIEIQVSECFGINTDSPIHLIKQLPLLYVFDGMDEVPNNIKKNVIEYLKEFVEQIGDSRILMTSRQETYLSEFYSFKRYSVNPLKEEETLNLLSKYDPTGNVSEKLISGLEQSKNRGLKEFLSTPLYVSLLFCSYRHKTVIPQKRHLFYSQVYEALYESHDLSKEVGYVRPKHSNLDSSEFHSVLGRLGFWCLKNNGKIEFQKDELEIIVTDILEKIPGLHTTAPSFVEDLISTVPLFVKEGTTVRCSHKSLMEYFSSMFICNDAKSRQEEISLKLFDSNSWSSYRNVFELCSDIDYGSFRSSICKRVLLDFIDYCDSAYKKIKNSRIKKIDIERRIGLSFSTNLGLIILGEGEKPRFRHKGFRKKFNACFGEGHNDVLESTIATTNFEAHLLHSDTKYKHIVGMIALKSPNLIENENEYFTWLTLGKTPFKSLKKDNIYFLNDDPKSTVNNSANFSRANLLFHVSSVEGDRRLNRKEVEKEIKAINRDNTSGIEKLLDGI